MNGTSLSSITLTSRSAWDSTFHGSVHTATLAVCVVLVIFVVILGTFGNGLVLLSAIHCRKLRSNFDVFILNLAGADFIMCSSLSPTFLYLLLSDPPSPKFFCGGFVFSCTACGLLSLLTLVAIAIHRHSRLRKVRGALTSTKTALILLVIYVVSFTSAIGGSVHVTLGWRGNGENCQAVLDSPDIYSNNVVLFFITPQVIVSFLIITASYLFIARAVRLQTHLRTKSVQPVVKVSSYKPFMPSSDHKMDSYQYGPNPLRYSHMSIQRSSAQTPVKQCACCSCTAALDRENKAISMCLVVMVIIILCWTPLIISHIVELLTGESIILYQVKLCGIALVFLSCALNPYLYAQNSGRIKHKYGQMFWNVLRCECRPPARQKFPILAPRFLSRPANRHTLLCPDGTSVHFLHARNRKSTIYKQFIGLGNQTEKPRSRHIQSYKTDLDQLHKTDLDHVKRKSDIASLQFQALHYVTSQKKLSTHASRDHDVTGNKQLSN